MANEIKMGKDGFLRITLSGDLDRGNIEMLRQDYSPFLEASTPEVPLNNIYSRRMPAKCLQLPEDILPT